MIFSWILALHIIAMVAWFAGLFYLPRLFVYHAMSEDAISHARFKTMEHKLFWMIMTPAGILTTLFGAWLLHLRPELLHHTFFIVKLLLVSLLWCYHVYCGYLMEELKYDRNRFSHRFYRFFNEIPTILLFGIVIMAIVKP